MHSLKSYWSVPRSLQKILWNFRAPQSHSCTPQNVSVTVSVPFYLKLPCSALNGSLLFPFLFLWVHWNPLSIQNARSHPYTVTSDSRRPSLSYNQNSQTHSFFYTFPEIRFLSVIQYSTFSE